MNDISWLYTVPKKCSYSSRREGAGDIWYDIKSDEVSCSKYSSFLEMAKQKFIDRRQRFIDKDETHTRLYVISDPKILKVCVESNNKNLAACEHDIFEAEF